MSDSDDNTYDDYLESRRAAIQKKRKPVAVYESDSDDDFPVKKTEPNKKMRSYEPNGDSDDDSIFEEVRNHDEVMTDKLDNLEEEYRRELTNSKHSVLHVQGTTNDYLTKTMEKVGAFLEPEKQIEIEDICIDKADTSSTQKESTTVRVVINDCESRISKRNCRDMDIHSTFAEVRKELSLKWMCHFNEVHLMYNGNRIGDVTPHELGIVPFQVPLPEFDAIREEKERPSNVISPKVITIETVSDAISIKVQMKNRKKPIHLSVTEETTVEDIMKKVIESLAGDASIPSLSKMKAMFDDEYCENSQTCKDLGLEDADCIDIYY
ncbi:hypothetical protein L5515_004154 [Caenorhabditis briggsae]|uniref:Ubiquitin-like domain-containing protein n=3 Tax=Caenorhabditis briggsae TaxID=6238 RepID=A0AAE9EKK9_CAEBR|nr:hypothetical protein L5515_004154 [Caenorhabditis briggsae]